MLTNAMLKGLKKPTDGRTHFLPDGAVGGLGVLYGASGRPAWTLAYRDNTGKQIRQKLGFAWAGARGAEPTSEWLGIDAARAEALRLKEAARAGNVPEKPKRSPAPAAAAGYSLERAIEEYAAKHLSTLRSGAGQEHILRKELAPLLPRALRSITRADIRGVLDGIMERDAGFLANRVHSVLGTMFRWAIDREMITTSPMPNQRPMRKEASRDRVLCDKELAAVWHATASRPLPQQGVTRLLILCGQRLGETSEMEWNELDLEARTWTIPRIKTKNGVEHVVPLSSQAVDVINSQHRIAGCRYVFTANGRSAINMSIEGGFLKRLTPDLPDWRIYDLRRSFRVGAASAQGRTGGHRSMPQP